MFIYYTRYSLITKLVILLFMSILLLCGGCSEKDKSIRNGGSSTEQPSQAVVNKNATLHGVVVPIEITWRKGQRPRIVSNFPENINTFFELSDGNTMNFHTYEGDPETPVNKDLIFSFGYSFNEEHFDTSFNVNVTSKVIFNIGFTDNQTGAIYNLGTGGKVGYVFQPGVYKLKIIKGRELMEAVPIMIK